MRLPLESITVGKRRRDDYGDIAGLAASIEKYGLLHPIVVDDEATLVAGERRLRAAQVLGWDTIEVRDLGELTDAERDEIELEENLQRKDLTAHERSKTLVRLAETAKTVLIEQAETCTDSVQVSKGTRGPARTPGSLRDVAERIGEPPMNIVKAQQHVEIVEAIPVLAGPDVKQYHALEAREKLERLPEADRPKAVALVNRAGVPPKDAVEILGNLSAMPAPERERVLTLADSTDTRDQSLALTEAAKRPAMPDPRISLLMDAVSVLSKAARMFPDDDMNDQITRARDTVRDVLVALKEYRRDAA